MTDEHVVVRPADTSWGAVLGGWVGVIGASVIFAPIVAGLIAVAGAPRNSSDLATAVPVVLGLLVSYLVGGYIAGRMAGYRTSWHGMMTAFFSLFILLGVLLLGAAADAGLFAGSGIRSLADVVPGVRDLSVQSLGDALTFGAILGFLAAIFGGWLGGLLAPSHPAVARAVTPVTPAARTERHEREVVRERRPILMPSFGRKGGERMEQRDIDKGVDEVHTTQVERRE